MSENVENRIKMERAIVRAAVEGLLAAGHIVGYHDGEEIVVPRGRDTLEEIMGELHSTDEATLTTMHQYEQDGSVFLVFGNDGYDVIADNSLHLESALVTASALASALETVPKEGLDLALAGSPLL